MNITYFDLLDLLDDDFDDDAHIDTIFLGFPSPLPQDHEDHGTDCMNFWKDRI